MSAYNTKNHPLLFYQQQQQKQEQQHQKERVRTCVLIPISSVFKAEREHGDTRVE